MPSESEPRTTEGWAKPVRALEVSGVEEGGAAINVAGKRPTSPIQGFGRMWQKTYRVRLVGAETTPRELTAIWKERFGSFWPAKTRFFAPLSGIAPGEVAALNMSMPGGLKLSTGVLVMYADEESFTLMTPQGHMFAGWITFSSHEEDGRVVAQTQVLMRAQDPISEMGLTMGGHRMENTFWEQTLTNLASHLGVEAPEVTTTVTCVDKKRQWSQAKNVRNSVAIRSMLHMLKPRKKTIG